MSIKSNDSLINKLHLFTRKLPHSMVLFGIILLLSIATGIISVALTNYHSLSSLLYSVIADGLLSGILIILIPTLLTVFVIKSVKRFVRIKYLLFIALIGACVYSLFIILASAIFVIVGNYSIASVIVLVGDASIYGWWFFINKVVLGQKKKAVLFALIQPVLNVLVYLFASGFIFTFAVPLNVLLIKLSAGIVVFLFISYIILYIFDTPVKKNLGFGGIEAFSQVVQNWLFDIDVIVSQPMGGENFGTRADIGVDTIVFRKSGEKSIKAIMFAPLLHYGPVGTMGGSDFPRLLERHALAEYDAPLFAMHCAVNEDNNPISNSQISIVKEALDKGVKGAKRITERKKLLSFSTSKYNAASVSVISINNTSIATLTRAPSVTEDITPECARLFKELLEANGTSTVIVDAHNSRYENAPEDELQGVRHNTKYMNEYVEAIKRLGKPSHSSSRIKAGVSSIDVYERLGAPVDLAPGKLNVIIFFFNGFKRAMIQFNANNMLPSFRSDIINHVKKSFGMDAEVYTTDTHFVNSLERNASNVLGRQTNPSRVIPILDRAMKEAIVDAENVDVYHKRDVMKNFRIWGPDVREKAIAVVTSVMGFARILVPAIVAAGFVFASWLISVV